MTDRYDELRAALAKASPAPWKAESTVYEHMISEVRCILPGSEHGIAQVWNGENGYADARFMALARRDVEALLSERDSLLAALKPFGDEARRLDMIHRAHPEPDDFRPMGLLKWGEFRRAAALTTKES